ncbi:AAA family ATPase [Ruminococcus sp.]|uniref:AAA family ATPase n=1 Tax=Ruminococcus sp. TaxID=41978 RepID=UPI002E77892C|nr:AAA family ATPase [Ruminococcus sp.]MEE1397786.1 AAA family ATPase [Ruminococcus sp.]
MSLKKKMLPIGVENFEKLRRNDMYYVDKTEMISDLIMNHGDANLFTRPRRFGKTLTMDMLKTFFEIGQDASLFDGLTISSHSDICEKYQNKYPVVFISLKGATGSTYEKANSMIKQLVAEEYQRHSYLADSDILDSIEKDQFNRIRSISLNEGDLENSLRTLTRLLCKHHNQKVILLIDEYDVPLDKSFLNGYYDDMVSFIRIFLGEALKTNDNTEFAVVTGCLRISKESIFTGVNNFKVFSINDTRFSDYFGFTNDEVKEMLSYYGIIDKYETTKAWYDGYLFGKTEIYCPWDVLNHCDTVVNTDDIEPQAYWINSSGNDIIRKFIEMANSTTKSELELLIAGNTVIKTIKQELTYADLYSSIENMWSILYMTGYLTKRSIPERKQFELAIPNLEIREIFEEQIYEWFKDFSRKDSSTLNAFCQTFADGNAEEAQKQFTAFLRKTISIRDTYVKAAKKENFYHGILLGLLSYRDDWIVKSNVESGDGYSDIVIKIPDDEIGMIIEVKYGEDADMEKGCADALAQIERMNYSEILEDDEVQTIYKYGIACYKKRCKIVKA